MRACSLRVWGRECDSKELAQAADFAVELAAAGATPKLVEDGFREAALQGKLFLTYVKKVVLTWIATTPADS